MSDQHSRERLSEYLDGELPAAEARELEVHLSGCAECAAALDDLRRVVARAAELEDRPPTEDLWLGIAERIGAVPAAGGQVVDIETRRRHRSRAASGRRFSFTLPQLVAASVALVVVSSAGAWLAVSGARHPAVAPAAVAESPEQPWFVSTQVDEKYGTAIAVLQRALEEHGETLDPETVRSIEENLLTINKAIADARRALAEDPSSDYLNDHLAKTMQLKLDFLRETTSLVSAS